MHTRKYYAAIKIIEVYLMTWNMNQHINWKQQLKKPIFILIWRNKLTKRQFGDKWSNLNTEWILDNINNEFPRCDNGIVVFQVLILKTSMLKDLVWNIILTSCTSEKLNTCMYKSDTTNSKLLNIAGDI